MYRIDSLLEDKLEKMNLGPNYRRVIINNLKYILDYGLEDLVLVALFGSCAKGSHKLGSDVDMLIITESQIDRRIRADIRGDISYSDIGIDSDIVFYTLDMFRSSDSIFARELKRGGVILWKRE